MSKMAYRKAVHFFNFPKELFLPNWWKVDQLVLCKHDVEVGVDPAGLDPVTSGFSSPVP